jgi:predicted alpha/beta hydrolase
LKVSDPNLPEIDIYTDDGWKLKAYHHSNIEGKNAPVMIFHAMALSAFSLNGNDGIPSIASWLSKNGFDAWVCECRGVGKAFHKDKRMRREWSFDDQLKYDVRAFIHSIQKATGHEKLHWIGHSMGGALLLAYLCTNDNSTIQSGIIAGSGFEVSNRNGHFKLPIKLCKFLKTKRIPLGILARFSRPFLQFVPDQYGFFSKKLTGESTCKAIMKDVHNIPVSLMRYAWQSYRKGGFCSNDDNRTYSSKAISISTPLLFLSSDLDLAWTPSVVEENLKFFRSGIAQMLPLGKVYGHADNYGHVDMLMGKNAEKEVFPEILKWLNSKKNSQHLR